MSIPPYPKGAPIEVFFAYDHNGIIHVTVFDMTGNKRLGELEIKRTSNLSEEQVTEKEQKMSRVVVN
jgi:molecular chaperone DnaK